MPIAVVCAGCEKQYQVKDEMAGKKIRCPRCSEIITVNGRAHDDVVVLDDDEDDDDYREPRALPEPRRRRRRDRRERRIRSDRGRGEMPWGWILGGIGGAAALVAVAMCFLLPPIAFVFAVGFVMVGLALNLIGGIGCLVKAFQEDVVCGILYLFVPFYGLYYLITRWDDVHPFGTCLLGGVGMQVIGIALIFGGAVLMQSNSSVFANRTNSTIPAANPVLPAGNPPILPEMMPQNIPQNVPFDIPNNMPPMAPRDFPQPPQNFAPPDFGPRRPPNFPQHDARPQVHLSEGEANIKTRPAPLGHSFSKGDTVYMHWGSSWCECEVLEVNGAGHPKVHWIGWSDSWDEFVSPDRVRVPRK